MLFDYPLYIIPPAGILKKISVNWIQRSLDSGIFEGVQEKKQDQSQSDQDQKQASQLFQA
jgi:hypothetical protein